MSLLSRTIQIVTAGDMSQTSIVSTGVDVSEISAFSIQAVFTGSPVGTFKLQLSDDTVATAALATNWTDITSSSQAISAAGDFAWSVSNPGYKFVRLVYTKTSGTGALNAVYNGKV